MRLAIGFMLFASLSLYVFSEDRLPTSSECIARLDLKWKTDDIETRAQYVDTIVRRLSKYYFSKKIDMNGFGATIPGDSMEHIYYQFPEKCKMRYEILDGVSPFLLDSDLFLTEIEVPRTIFQPGPDTIRATGRYWSD